MNIYFKKAIERFEVPFGSSRIAPISKIDSNIIELLLALVKNKKLVTYLKTNWKYLKDEEVYDTAVNYGFDVELEDVSGEEDEEGSGKSFSREIIIFEGKAYQANYIFSWEPQDDFDDEMEFESYSILLNKVNPAVTSMPIYANEKIGFNSEEERDDMLQEFTETMGELKNVKIINKYF